ncbi:MAG: hypothetical protein AAF620_17395 [Bacteroidota bacterium]
MKYINLLIFIYLIIALFIRVFIGINLTYGLGFLAVLGVAVLFLQKKRIKFSKNPMKMEGYPYKLRVYVICVLLFIPMLFKYLGLEIYPSIVMPGGIALISSTDEIVSFKSSQLYGISKERRDTIPIDVAYFLDPAPTHYFGAFQRSGFGMKNGSKGEIDAAKARWRLKLRRIGCIDSLFLFRKYQTIFPSELREILDEKSYLLY